jgi:hypothetical protein
VSGPLVIKLPEQQRIDVLEDCLFIKQHYVFTNRHHLVTVCSYCIIFFENSCFQNYLFQNNGSKSGTASI